MYGTNSAKDSAVVFGIQTFLEIILMLIKHSGLTFIFKEGDLLMEGRYFFKRLSCPF